MSIQAILYNRTLYSVLCTKCVLCVYCLSQHCFGVIALTDQSTITPKQSAPIFSMNFVFMGTFMISIISVSGIGIDFIELIYNSRAGKLRFLLVTQLFLVQSMLLVNLFRSAFCMIFVVQLIFATIQLCQMQIETFFEWKSVHKLYFERPVNGGGGLSIVS